MQILQVVQFSNEQDLYFYIFHQFFPSTYHFDLIKSLLPLFNQLFQFILIIFSVQLFFLAFQSCFSPYFQSQLIAE